MVKYLIALLILVASLGACDKDLADLADLSTSDITRTVFPDLIQIDTIWGKLDSAGCECHGMDSWFEIERIDTVEVANEKDSVGWLTWAEEWGTINSPGWASADTLPPSQRQDTARDQDNCSLLHFVTQYHGGIAFIVHIAKHCPNTAREYMRVDTVEVCPEGFLFTRFRNLPGWESWCIPCDNPLLLSQKPTSRIDTTWHPKVLKRQCCHEMRRRLEAEMDAILDKIHNNIFHRKN